MELRSGQASPAYRFGAGVKSLARVVYCQPLENTKFAVGLQLVVRVEGVGKFRYPRMSTHREIPPVAMFAVTGSRGGPQ